MSIQTALHSWRTTIDAYRTAPVAQLDAFSMRATLAEMPYAFQAALAVLPEDVTEEEIGELTATARLLETTIRARLAEAMGEDS